jgi:hypothetical protein
MCIPVKPNTDAASRQALSPTRDLPLANVYHYPQPSSVLVRVRRGQVEGSDAILLPPDQEYRLDRFLEEDLIRKRKERNTAMSRDYTEYLAAQNACAAEDNAASRQCLVMDQVAPMSSLSDYRPISPPLHPLLAASNAPRRLPTYGAEATEAAPQDSVYQAIEVVPTFEGPCDPYGEIVYDEMPEDDMEAFNHFAGCYQQAVRERDTLTVINPSYDLSTLQSFAHPDDFFEEKDYLLKYVLAISNVCLN